MQNETLEAHEPELHSGETKDAPVANVLESREEAREAFEARSLDFFEDLLPEDTEEFSGIEDPAEREKRGELEDMVARGLTGMDSEKAWVLRDRLYKNRRNWRSLAESLAGLDSELAWQWRDRFKKDGVNPKSIAIGLAGLDSERVRDTRREFYAWGVDKGSLAVAFAFIDTARAREGRNALVTANSRATVAESLAGLDAPEDWEFREYFLEKLTHEGSVIYGMTGLDSPPAWKMRKRLIEKDPDNGAWVARSLKGLDSEEAWAMRQQLFDGERDFNDDIAEGLAGLDTGRAWEWRKRLLEAGASELGIAKGLAGLDSPRAWEWRERLLKESTNKPPYRQSAIKETVVRGLSPNFISSPWLWWS